MISRRLLIVSIFTSFLLTACGYTEYLKPYYLAKVDFNNKYVDYINTASRLSEESFQKYEEIIPSEVSPNQQLDVSMLEVKASAMTQHLAEKDELSLYISLNKDQDKVVKAQFEPYIEEFNEFIALYKDIYLFYSAKEYQTEGNLVAEYNQKLAMKYETFLSAHEKFAKVLAEYVE